MELSIGRDRPGQARVVVSPSGEIDFATSPAIREAITEILAGGGVREIDLDLSAVTFLDSTGIGTLVVASRICNEVGVRLSVRNANPFVARLFAVVGVAEALNVAVPAGPNPTLPVRQRTGNEAPQLA